MHIRFPVRRERDLLYVGDPRVELGLSSSQTRRVSRLPQRRPASCTSQQAVQVDDPVRQSAARALGSAECQIVELLHVPHLTDYTLPLEVTCYLPVGIRGVEPRGLLLPKQADYRLPRSRVYHIPSASVQPGGVSCTPPSGCRALLPLPQQLHLRSSYHPFRLEIPAGFTGALNYQHLALPKSSFDAERDALPSCATA